MKRILPLMLLTLLIACQPKSETQNQPQTEAESTWQLSNLKQKAESHLNQSQWDTSLFKQDIDTYQQFADIFQSYPLNKSPFPVAEYDYAVSSIPFTTTINQSIFKGIRIGEYVNPETDEIRDKLTLLVLTNNDTSSVEVLVESRNYPYLTAEGRFLAEQHILEWVFNASPDGYATLMVNMKLFDLRFGETIIIFPQTNQSFLYHQLELSTNQFDDFKAFENQLKADSNIQKQLKSEGNIKG